MMKPNALAGMRGKSICTETLAISPTQLVHIVLGDDENIEIDAM